MCRDILFQSNDRIEYLHDASGVKRKAKYQTTKNLNLAYWDRRELSPADILNTLVTNYYGNKVYENDALKRIYTEEGYIAKEGNLYKAYYYLKDHLGSIRAVMDEAGNVIQKNYYYPFGLLTVESTTQEKQPLKYNGKELEKMQGMNWYDYSARLYDPVTARFLSMDPLAEKYYNISPYAYCANNPVNAVDPTGMLVDDYYYNEKGDLLYKDVINKPDRNFVIKTTKTTTELYGSANYNEKGNSSPITKDAAATTETEISNGNLTGAHMKNVVQIESTSTMEKMTSIVSKDDGTGGTTAANNKEYGGFIKNGTAVAAKSGSVGDPSKGQNASIIGNVDFHSHPSGDKKVTGGTAMWAQPPSATDIKTATGKDYVFGMKEGTIYIFTTKGVIATMPILNFKNNP